MVGWHHQLDGHEFEHAPGIDDGQRSLDDYGLWGRKELDRSPRLSTHVDKDNTRLLKGLEPRIMHAG